jgi:hypothetical protein
MVGSTVMVVLHCLVKNNAQSGSGEHESTVAWIYAYGVSEEASGPAFLVHRQASSAPRRCNCLY